jgi:peroxiredoxin Q/BCP
MNDLAKMRLTARLLVAGALFLATSLAADEPKGLKVGDKAPVFQSTDDQGKEWKLADHVGKKVLVLFFHPGNFSPGSIIQASDFRDNMKKLADNGVMVVGISGDSAKAHAFFKKELDLGFTQLADEKGELAKSFGIRTSKGGRRTVVRPGLVYQKLGSDGNMHTWKIGSIPAEIELPLVLIQRHTVVIDRDGNIAAKYEAGSTRNSEKILEIVGKLQAK